LSIRDHSNVRPISPKTLPKRSKSPKISFVVFGNQHSKQSGQTTPSTNVSLNSLLLTDESLPLMKTSPLDLLSNEKSTTNQQSNSSDSGCYDRNSSNSSMDTHSNVSSTINGTSSTVPSARLTSASTRRSNLTKKVSFEDQSSTIIITTATYV